MNEACAVPAPMVAGRAILTGDIGCQRFEQRKPRAAMTRKLEAICRRLDASPVVEGVWEPLSFAPKERFRASAGRLWVAGSYARGALTCGDLDLLLDGAAWRLDQTGRAQERQQRFERDFARALCGGVADVRLYVGSPNENTSGARLDDAVLIWDGPGCGWRDRISGIRDDPHAGRYWRKADAIPFRAEQYDRGGLVGDLLVDLREEGLFDWRFMPITGDDLAPIAEDDARHWEIAERLMRFWYKAGAKTTQIGAAAVRALAAERPFWERAQVIEACGPTQIAGAELRVGMPRLYERDFAAMPLGVETLVLLPHFSTRGPNGAWLISRGREHPLVRALSERPTYSLATAGGRPFLIERAREPVGVETAVFLFKSEDAAQVELARRASQRRRAVLGEPAAAIVNLRGADLLRWLAVATTAIIDGRPHVLRRNPWLRLYHAVTDDAFLAALGLHLPHEPRLDVGRRAQELRREEEEQD